MSDEMNDNEVVEHRLRKPGTMSYYKYQHPPLDLDNSLDWNIEIPRLWRKYKWNPLFLIVSIIWLEIRTRWRWTREYRYLVTERDEPWHWRIITGMELRYERWKKERAAQKAKMDASTSDS